MALLAMSTSHVEEFVSDMDPAKTRVEVPVDPNDPNKGSRSEVKIGDDATVFRLRSLDVFLMGYIYDGASVLRGRQGDSDIGIHTRVNQTNIDAVRFGLADIPGNFKDRHGHPIRFKTQKEIINGRSYDAVTPEVLNALGLRLIAEMAERIKEISSVTPDEEKN
jgi:hypothetical protein